MKKTINFSEIVSQLEREYDHDPELMKTIIQEFLLEIRLNLCEGKRVTVDGFGSFHLSHPRTKNLFNFRENKSTIQHIAPKVRFQPSGNFNRLLDTYNG